MNRAPCRKCPRPLVMLSLAGFLLVLGACSPAPDPAGEIAEVAPTLTATPAQFRPTVTPLPPPTELPLVTPPTATVIPTITPTPTRDPNVLTVLMEPNLGDLETLVRLEGLGFEPESEVELFWTEPDEKPSGAPDATVETDEAGTFKATLTVPAVWPGGTPEERDLLELRAVGDEGRSAWATYTYVVPFTGFVAPASTYTNTVYGYSVDLPPGWVAQDADAANVLFGPEGETAASFIRVISEADVGAAIATVMDEVAAGASYDIEDSKLGAEEGKRVTVTDSGQVYWFLGQGGRTYALHFVADDATVAEFTYTTFRFSG